MRSTTLTGPCKERSWWFALSPWRDVWWCLIQLQQEDKGAAGCFGHVFFWFFKGDGEWSSWILEVLEYPEHCQSCTTFHSHIFAQWCSIEPGQVAIAGVFRCSTVEQLPTWWCGCILEEADCSTGAAVIWTFCSDGCEQFDSVRTDLLSNWIPHALRSGSWLVHQHGLCSKKTRWDPRMEGTALQLCDHQVCHAALYGCQPAAADQISFHGGTALGLPKTPTKLPNLVTWPSHVNT